MAASGSANNNVVRVHLIITGRVQGVFYRASTRATAMALGVNGWVRNLPNGSVEAVAEGEADAVEQLAAWCRQGPRGAFVTGMTIKKETPTGEFRSFEVRY
ncbi:MAG: acylphosphatase [Nitrospirae bacterium]|nr:acylphosphatase [Nitrospirota bacterium]